MWTVRVFIKDYHWFKILYRIAEITISRTEINSISRKGSNKFIIEKPDTKSSNNETCKNPNGQVFKLSENKKPIVVTVKKAKAEDPSSEGCVGVFSSLNTKMSNLSNQK